MATPHKPFHRKTPPSNQKRTKPSPDQYLHFTRTIRIYVDCSISTNGESYGIAANIIGNDKSVLSSEIHPHRHLHHSCYAEIHAILHALEQATLYLKEVRKPNSLVILSDVNWISNLDESYQEHPQFGELVKEIFYLKSSLQQIYPRLKIIIQYLDKKEKRGNPYHVAVHHASRQALKPQPQS